MHHIIIATSKNNKIPPCAIFARASSQDHANTEHFSLSAQQEYCKAEIRRLADDISFHVITLPNQGSSGFTSGIGG
jgi:hypothetical protein